ncbi:MAG: YchJ family metal-binding protein [Parasulfuritortus sp.]|nr:YchJ family metal-binding protein [Parasulfuritortus sp.]
MKNPCPCGLAADFEHCCDPYLSGAPAPDAESLMRSRYSAYVLGDEPYLLASWHPDTRPETLDLKAEEPAKWLGLSVKRHEQFDDSHATVEFVARYKIGGRAHRLHEVSRFERLDGRWYYRDGDLLAK